MQTCLLVSGDFVCTGGMDMANYALASYLARSGVAVHLVAHRVAPELAGLPGVSWHRVVKPLNSYLLGSPLLDRVGRRWGRRLASRGARVVVNGGNCQWGDVNWVHYVHAAYAPVVATGATRAIKEKVARSHFLSTERRALARARLTLVNSNRTGRDVVERLGAANEAVHTVYYGVDAERFGSINARERAEARAELGWPADRRVLLFIGALGDRRKGFDLLFRTWEELCAQPEWDVDLAVVGTGAELPLWVERTAEAGLGQRIRFMGFSRNVPRLLAAADALVHPARYEAYGLGVHEALCRGLPAIVSASAGVAERYPSRLHPLLIAETDTHAALRACLVWWRANHARAADDIRPFAEELRRWTWDSMASRIRALIDDAPPRAE